MQLNSCLFVLYLCQLLSFVSLELQFWCSTLVIAWLLHLRVFAWKMSTQHSMETITAAGLDFKWTSMNYNRDSLSAGVSPAVCVQLKDDNCKPISSPTAAGSSEERQPFRGYRVGWFCCRKWLRPKMELKDEWTLGAGISHWVSQAIHVSSSYGRSHDLNLPMRFLSFLILTVLSKSKTVLHVRKNAFNAFSGPRHDSKLMLKTF